MHGIIIEIEGYEKEVSDETSFSNAPEQNAGQRLLERMKLVYSQVFTEYYEPKLLKDGKNESIYPRFSVIIDEEVYDVDFDEDLYRQLGEIYIVEGWAGIEEIEKRINEVCKDDSKELAGGVTDKKWAIDVHPKEANSWNLAKNLFTLTKNILALLIRETLINLEKLSAERIIAKLSVSNVEIAKAWNRYKIQTQTVTTKSDSLLKGHDIIEKTIVYSIGDAALAKDLFKLLTSAVNEKITYDELFINLIDTQGILSGKKGYHQYEDAEIEALKKKEREILTLKSASENLLKSLEDLINCQHPFGLLIYGALKKDFEQSDMENLFGAAIDNLRKEFETLAQKINPQTSKVAQMIYFKESGDLTRDIYNFQIPSGGLEKYVLETSLKNFEDHAFLPMLSEENFDQLFSHEIIEEDSFKNIVGFHYLSALTGKLGEIKNQEKEVENFWKTIGKISAALALVALIVPQARPILAGVESLANLALLAYTINSVTENLRKNDELLSKTLVNQDDFSTDFLAQVGEVISLKKEFADNLTIEIAKEIFNTFGGSKLPGFKQYLFARNYYYDLETLAEPEENEGDAK
jgi:hypothetical protein